MTLGVELMPGDPMTREEAEDYAAQWGETASEGGLAAYNLGSSCEDKPALLAYVQGECLAIARAGDCCGLAGECAEDVRQLGRLAAYLKESS